mmetsp:Transcript_29340/g.42573  ORF Transcript_29340/g.42573 Transcript_29340/m.42573 type:complete len:345 (+) Transcript_29340:155-1189(+)
MQATRRLLSQPGVTSQVPPRGTLDVLKSAGNACLSLLSQQNRDSFLDSLNSGIIRPEVLGQSEMGMAKILALHNDLSSPLFSKYKFEVTEFTEGVKPALCRFHEVQSLLQTKVGDEKKEGNKGDDIKDEQLEREQKALRDFLAMDISNMENGGMASIAEAVGMRLNWTEEAKEDPESLAGQLMSMLTDEYFKIVELTANASFMRDGRFRYVDGSAEINNVALLSARALEIPNSTDDAEETISPIDEDRPMKDESLDGPLKKSTQSDMPVGVQMEVLYDVKMTYEHTDVGGKEAENVGDGEELTRTSILVAVFEAWLHGDPDGNDSLRWKLAVVRPAWEFPLVNQ